MNEQISNPEIKREADLFDLKNQLKRWEDATSKAEQGSVARLDLISDRETLSRVSEEISRGDVTELVDSAQNVLDEMYENSKQSALNGVHNLKQSNEEIIANNSTCKWVLDMKRSLLAGELDVIKNPNMFDSVMRRLSAESQSEETKIKNEEGFDIKVGCVVNVKRSSGEWENDWKVSEINQEGKIARVIKQKPENGQIIYKDVFVDQLNQWQKESQLTSQRTTKENSPREEWTKNRIREAVINIGTLLTKQEEALRNNDIKAYDNIYEQGNQMLEELYKSIPKEMYHFATTLVAEQSHNTEQRRKIIGARADELRKRNIQ